MTTALLARRRQGKTESASEFISSMTRAFDSMCVYNEYEKIPVIQNGLRDDLRMRAMSVKWRSVSELNEFLSQIEIADELHASSNRDGAHHARSFQRRSLNAIEVGGACGSDCCEGNSDAEGNGSMVSEDVEICAFGTGRPKVTRDPRHVHKRYASEKKSTATSGPSDSLNSEERKKECFNCKSEAHYFRNCDKPVNRIFCFTCGEEGKLSPNCTHESMPKNLTVVARSRPLQSEATQNKAK